MNLLKAAFLVEAALKLNCMGKNKKPKDEKKCVINYIQSILKF